MARRLKEEVCDYAAEQLALGGTSTDVTKEVAGHFSMSERHARRYIAVVRDRWRTEGAVNRDERRAQLRASAEAVFRKAQSLGHWKTCLNALRFLADLDGVMAPQQVEVQHSSSLGDGTVASLAVLQARVDELRAGEDDGGGEDDGANVN